MILVLAEHFNGEVDVLSRQTLTFARGMAEELGVPLEAAVVGDSSLASPGGISDFGVSNFGVSKLHLIKHEELKNFSPESWSSGVSQLYQSINPKILIAPASVKGNEVSTLVSLKLSIPLATNITKVVAGDKWEVTRNCWAGSLLDVSSFTGDNLLLTVAPQTVEEAPSASSQVETSDFVPEITEKDTRIKMTGVEKPVDEGKSLDTASVVIGGGRGTGSPEGFEPLQQLADLIGGVVGGSRVTTNNGWIPHRQQIGLTGTRISPKLYIACGVSGAIQHIYGCKDSKNILVINKDPDAPFFSKANYGVVGDMHEIIPAVIEELKG